MEDFKRRFDNLEKMHVPTGLSPSLSVSVFLAYLRVSLYLFSILCLVLSARYSG